MSHHISETAYERILLQNAQWLDWVLSDVFPWFKFYLT